MADNVLWEFSEKIIERFFTQYPIKFSSRLIRKLLKQGKIDIGGYSIIPSITTDKIIFLSYTKDKNRDLCFLVIRDNLDRIKSDIGITISDQNDDSWFICFLMGELLKIAHTK